VVTYRLRRVFTGYSGVSAGIADPERRHRLGLPAALGGKLALPNRPVVALVGDGSSMYTNQALWTAARESLAVVYVIFNNTSYRILKQQTKALKGFSARTTAASDVGPAVSRALRAAARTWST
jgi:thiamine pyrophosphate-dependent acetolactate synthase large subunit-like protein